MVMDYAIAVNAEARELEKAGADIIQLDEPWLRNDPEAAKRVAVQAINRALRRPEGTDHRAPVLRLCGAGAGRDQARRLLVPAAAGRHHCRPDLHRGGATQARPRRAGGAGAEEGRCWASSISTIRKAETPQMVAERIRAALKFVPADRADPGARLRHEVSAARGGLRQAEGPGRGCGHRAQGVVAVSVVTDQPHGQLEVARTRRVTCNRNIRAAGRGLAVRKTVYKIDF